MLKAGYFSWTWQYIPYGKPQTIKCEHKHRKILSGWKKKSSDCHGYFEEFYSL